VTYKEDMSKDTHVSARVQHTKKDDYRKVAGQLGYKDLSPFVVDVLDAFTGVVGADGWECRMVHISGDRIVGVGHQVDESVPTPVSAFEVIAPAHFWRLLERRLSDEHQS